MRIVEQYLLQLKNEKRRWRRAATILAVLSLLVATGVSWNLRMIGITLVNDASCGYVEHQHTEECLMQDTACGYEEHIHSLSCCSDPKADVETPLDWREMFEDYPYVGSLREDLVGIAKTQVGYTESMLNFSADDNKVRHGYTRYGAWYGAPYNDWSAMFVSFCLHYAGADLNEYPVNSGVDTMADLWDKQGNYVPAGEYVPVCGDLAFFEDSTVGVVAEMQNATIYVISGDVNDAVSGKLLPMNDVSIIGWGITGDPLPEEEPPHDSLVDEELPDDEFLEEELLAGSLEDTLLAGSDSPDGSLLESSSEQLSLMQTEPYNPESAQLPTALSPYLNANGGSYFFTLLDLNNEELPKDEQGNYIAVANHGYKLTLTINSPNGFLPGTYQHQIPNGMMIDGGSGEFVLTDGANVGSWEATDTGLITLVFNEHINSRTDIVISSTLGIHFPEQQDPVDFDGMITVKIEPPIQQKDPTVLSKWGTPNGEAGKINWTARIDGHADSQIPGNILTDQPTLSDWSRPHSYTQSDIDNGLTFGVSDPAGGWHAWTVFTDDPHLVWDETGWTYKIPHTVTCDYCGELELGNDGWVYLINYTSTPDKLNTPGTFDYENKVTVDGQTGWGWSNFTQGEIEAEITKNGSFVSDAAGGGFLWEVQATIPGRPEGQRAEYSWFIMDEMRLMDETGTIIGRAQNDINLAEVTAIYNGVVIKIPRVQDATDQDMFAWDNAWTSTENGISSTRTINLLCRCQCTAETCHWTGCGEYWYQDDNGQWNTNGFCQCWTQTQNMTFTFVYKTEALSIIQDYGTLGYQLNNHAQLYYMPDGSNSTPVSYDDAAVAIPNLFEKKLTHDYDGYTAHYRITVNEAKAVLTNGTPLTIHDVMTETLAYISGTLVIKAETAYGLRSTLQQDIDYTVTYDGTGNQTDPSGNKVHVLDIVILKPQPVMYIIDYDTTLVMPQHVTGSIKYSNSATITLWGKYITDDAVEKVHADINIAAKSYTVEMFKTCAQTKQPLLGATFGLYNEKGGLITSGTTDANGKLQFQTNIIRGIILREHELYYMQEIQPPPAYQLDETKYWFCFCNGTGDTCSECNKIMVDPNTARIPFETVGLINIVNHRANVVLPETGGIGTHIYMLCGLIFMAVPLVYGLSLRRKYERRARE